MRRSVLDTRSLIFLRSITVLIAAPPNLVCRGFAIDVDRVFYQGDEEVNRETFTTDYNPSPRVICGERPSEKDERDEKDEKDENTDEGGDTDPMPEPTSDSEPDGGPDDVAVEVEQVLAVLAGRSR